MCRKPEKHGGARECRAAIRLRPGYAPAYVNLADLYRAEGRDGEAESVLREGLAAAPDDAALHHALGLLLVRRGRAAEALAELERAVQLDANDARYAYVLGIALHSAGHTERALAVLETARTRRPGDRDVLMALATINRDRGNAAAAREYAAQLSAVDPDDPGVRSLRQQLGMR